MAFNFKDKLDSLGNAFKKHSPEICIGAGIGGLIFSIVVAIKVTPKALDLINKKKEELNTDKLSKAEEFKASWKCYIPVVSVAAVSSFLIIAGTKENLKRNAALSAAYAISESALLDYRNKVRETIGERKEQDIRDSIAEDKLKSNPVNNEVIIVERGNTLCYDVISGRYFKFDIDKLRKVENEINRRLRDEMFISLNDFYYELGLPSIKIGDKLGWSIEKGYLSLELTSKLATDNTPCLVISYEVGPEYDYRD